MSGSGRICAEVLMPLDSSKGSGKFLFDIKATRMSAKKIHSGHIWKPPVLCHGVGDGSKLLLHWCCSICLAVLNKPLGCLRLHIKYTILQTPYFIKKEVPNREFYMEFKQWLKYLSFDYFGGQNYSRKIIHTFPFSDLIH